MFLKIIILLELFFLVDNTIGICGSCQENHVICLNEDTFSLCVEGKPTDSVVPCPQDTVCTDDPGICIAKDNDTVIASCVTGSFSMESGRLDVSRSNSSKSTPDSTIAVVSNGETAITTDNHPSTSAEYDTSLSTQHPDTTTVDPTVSGVSDGVISTTTDKPYTQNSTIAAVSDPTSEPNDNPLSTQYSDTTIVDSTLSGVSDDIISTSTDESTTTDFEEGEILSTTDSIDTIMTDNEVSSITNDLSSTESSIFSTQDISTNDISTIDIETTTSVPRDATTFCSEIKDVGTFKAPGDTTCKRYYVCTTHKDGFKGYEFNCGENYFNSEISLCQKEKPDDC